MNWKKVSEEMPPVDKYILIGRIRYYGDKNEFNWIKTIICHPFLTDRKYNPDYFYFHHEDEIYELSPNFYWADPMQIGGDILKELIEQKVTGVS